MAAPRLPFVAPVAVAAAKPTTFVAHTGTARFHFADIPVGAPDSAYEREAERVADAMVGAPETLRRTPARTDLAPGWQAHVRGLQGHERPLDGSERGFFEPRFSAPSRCDESFAHAQELGREARREEVVVHAAS